MRIIALLLLLAAPSAAAAQAPLRPLEANLAKATADYDRDPSSAENASWLGRRLAYLGAKAMFDRVLVATIVGDLRTLDRGRLP